MVQFIFYQMPKYFFKHVIFSNLIFSYFISFSFFLSLDTESIKFRSSSQDVCGSKNIITQLFLRAVNFQIILNEA